MNTDKRNRLGETPFSYRINKENTVSLEYFGKQVKILKGKEAERFLKRMDSALNEKETIMAKATGNFKRENEKQALEQRGKE